MSNSNLGTARSSSTRGVDVTMLVTFHNEGILAHSTLNCLERCRKFALSHGVSTEYIWVFDSISDETRDIVLHHPAFSGECRYIEVSYSDAGPSRNAGIALASGTAVAVLDGDDYYSTNWIERAWAKLQEYGPNAILHPEMVINFGEHNAYGWHPDQCSEYYQEDGLLTNNYWTSWTFSFRETYQQIEYASANPRTTGFGYEDWHWNCETIANGYVHRTVPGTLGFYRRKANNSLVNTTTTLSAIMPPTKLFDAKKDHL